VIMAIVSAYASGLVVYTRAAGLYRSTALDLNGILAYFAYSLV